jgi:hypothetical protein
VYTPPGDVGDRHARGALAGDLKTQQALPVVLAMYIEGMSQEPTVLRRELRSRAHEYIAAWKLPQAAWYESPGGTVLFRRYGNRHGNFLDRSYQAIQWDDGYMARFRKLHRYWRVLLLAAGTKAKGLDSSSSSDALLMNVFCYPGDGRGTGSTR